ncbi:putative C6 transcription factor [Aspergillus fischeri NRRL 181]|uniref:C6 transcription factor, putative n=1 Tax=Neosartorya fischeri (strain ATCC 1020 / DSM 3700 / CBS 544.65 / FGSC A1164 / JCM 1740 / NRRL 181 / WB 181) TaxID=331117 RepID=A1DBD3_NEOFI|nr:C6 transcription factor, putative [Aspergillus fischeri NRRL 181]EAW20173.1 C6 transcription factor, putative [Aspergillus fischeri NRRL 181]
MSPTPPSTSSSIGAVSPDGQFRVIRKRNRVPLSCGPCRHRKLKCNRAHPCENCVKRGDASSCTYAQASARRKNATQNSASSSPDDMQNRIDRLESLVLSLMTNGSQSAGPAAAMAAISGTSSSGGSLNQSHDIDLDDETSNAPEESDTEQVTKSFGIMKVDNNKSYYISDAHWASLLNDIAEVRNYFHTYKKQYEEQAEKFKTTKLPSDVPGSTLLLGAMKPASRAEIMSSFPSRYTTDMLIARYFNSYDPATHILHGPTFQAQYNKHWEDPSQTCIVWVGMLFAMMRLAMLSYNHEGDEPPEFRGKSLDMAGTFRNLVAQCLTLADYTKPYPYLIETFIFHLHGDFRQTKEADISVWVLVGVVARLAMRMGYHRDSKVFPNITPFQGEMRRRVWTFVRQSDLLFSFQVGLPSMIRTVDSDTELPRNLYDDDFDENCRELPPSRPANEPTPISYLIAKARLAYVFGRVTELTSSVQSESYDKVMELDAELRRARDLIPEHLVIRPFEECQLDPSNLIMSRFGIMSVYHKAQCVLHRPYIVLARGNPRFAYSRKTCIDSAMELLRFQSMLHAETRPTGRLRTKQNRINSLSSTDYLLAATIVCFDLYHGLKFQAGGRDSGDTVAWGRERRQEMIIALQRSREIWDELREESLEAWKAAGILGVMLAKLNLGFPDSNATAPAFEPQDEKQSAAMTLGLLSSGINAANSGSPAFNETGFKVSETPSAPGAFGSTAEVPGALSPFSTMFGQMPDMQLNLDWDSWDTYIQSSNLDIPNQWWPTFDGQQQQPSPQPPLHPSLQAQGPLSSTQLPSMQQGNTADNMRSLPRFSNVFSPDPVKYESPGINGPYDNNSPQKSNNASGEGIL